jgi:hypothetical protein
VLRLRLLIIGFATSPHIVRYLELLEGAGIDIHLFDSVVYTKPNPDLPAISLHVSYPWTASPGSAVHVASSLSEVAAKRAAQVEHLASVIDDVNPDIVHTHELQHGATLVDALRRRRGSLGAPWLVTNWGTDIFGYRRDPVVVPDIRSVMTSCDYYGAECHRDVALARAYGFRGRVVGVWPITGGIDIEHATALRAPGPTSARRAIAWKGAKGPLGRGDVALEAVRRCADLLRGWELCAYQADADLEESARGIAQRAGCEYTHLSSIAAHESTHDEILAMHGRSRVSLGLNRSDGLSTSFLEAMAMGSFPVHSSTSCGGEIAPHGRSALFVDGRDPEQVAAALRRALTDDQLVDDAADLNVSLTAAHLDRRLIRARVLDMYGRIAAEAALERV